MKNALRTFRVIASGLFYLLASVIALGQAPGYPVRVAGNHDISPQVQPSLAIIYSNLNALNGKDRYDCAHADYVMGPESKLEEEQWLAMPFTPAANRHVKKIKLPIQWDSVGPNDVTIKIYSGVMVPTTLVPGSTRTLHGLPTFTGSACWPLPTVNYPGAGIPLTAGTQYWVVAKTNPASTTTEDVWCYIWNDAREPFAYDNGNGWIFDNYRDNAYAFAVLGY
jgi:hypothetical protein